MKAVAYSYKPERITLSDADVPKAVRTRARSACASSVGKFAWLRMDVCASWRSGPKPRTEKIVSSVSVVEIIREFAAEYMNLREFFGVLCLDNRGAPIGFAVISVGGTSSTAVDPKILFKPVLLSTASSMIVTHNHPSGIPEPSQDDIALTERISQGAKLLGLQLLDHVIIAEGKSFSFLDHGLLKG